MKAACHTISSMSVNFILCSVGVSLMIPKKHIEFDGSRIYVFITQFCGGDEDSSNTQTGCYDEFLLLFFVEEIGQRAVE